MTINILHLTYRRTNRYNDFVDLSHYLLSKCKFKNFHLTLCSIDSESPTERQALDGHHDGIKKIAERASKLGLNVSIISAPSVKNNYLVKINKTTKLNYEYTIKMDEDIFMGPNAWDFLFENINVLNNENNILLAPALSTGIPTCDDFIKYNFTEFDKEYIYYLYNKTYIENLWADYSTIRNYLLNNKYDSYKYFEIVRNLQTPFKGIHPVRTNKDVILFVNNKIEENINKFLEARKFFITEMKEPYFCNSFFAIKTQLYNKIINDPILYQDGFDEVPINKYREITGKKFLYIPNTFAIHTLYNTIINDKNVDLMYEYEYNFVNTIKREIYKGFNEH